MRVLRPWTVGRNTRDGILLDFVPVDASVVV
jgi:hypothetical protein